MRGVHGGGCGPGQRPWERLDQARSRKVWLLLHQLECISSSRKSSSRILIIFCFISVFSLTPPLLSSLSILPTDSVFRLQSWSLIVCCMKYLFTPSKLSLSVSCNRAISHSFILPFCQSPPVFFTLSLKILFTFPSCKCTVMSVCLQCCCSAKTLDRGKNISGQITHSLCSLIFDIA